jgi:hypothetical protein
MVSFCVSAIATTTFAQDSKKIGIQANAYVGVPVGKIASESNFNAGVSIGYLGSVEPFFRVGGSIGYDYSVLNSDSKIPKEKGFQYLMVGGTAELDVYKNFYIGADLGYAFSQAKDGLGSHYFTPKLGYKLNDTYNIYAHYKGVRFSGYQVASLGVGMAFNF